MHACQARVGLHTCTLLMTLAGTLPQGAWERWSVGACQAMAAPGAQSVEDEMQEVKAEVKKAKEKVEAAEKKLDKLVEGRSEEE